MVGLDARELLHPRDGRLTVLCKSAHLYEPEWALMKGLVAQGAWLQPGAGTA